MCVAVLGSDLWEPLAGDLGWAAMLLGAVGVGVTLRWWAVLAVSATLAVTAFAVRPREEVYDTTLTLVALVPTSALIAAAAALAGRRLRHPRLPVGLLGGAGALVVVGIALSTQVVDRVPTAPVQVVLTTGALPDVSLGGDAAALPPRLGRRVLSRDLDSIAPLGASDDELSGPSSIQGEFEAHRFDDVAVFVRRGRIVGYVTTDPDIEVGEGVGIGDSIDLLEDRGLPFNCSGVSLGSDSTRPAYPICEKPVRQGPSLILGGDPIDSIWLVH